MNWKCEAIEKLKEYTVRANSVDSIPREIARLEESIVRIRSALSDATPVAGGGSGREDMLLSNIVHREELKIRLTDAKRWLAMMDRAFAMLTEEDKLILDRFYIRPLKGNVDRLCEELSVEKAAVYKRKDKALRRFTLALYGITES